MRRHLLVFVLLLVIFNLLNAQNKEFETFWINFKTALSEGDEKKIIDLTYFASSEEKEYFSFSLIFDNEAIITITQATASDLIKFDDKSAEYDENPFEILDLPVEINELYLIHVTYEDATIDDVASYQRVYAFGKYKGNYLFLGFYSMG
jgi:hypothetical protein